MLYGSLREVQEHDGVFLFVRGVLAVESKTANPSPLGLSGFALTTLFLSFINAGFIGANTGSTDALVVVGLALFYGGIAQLLAGMWAFRAGNTFSATAFSSYGAFWLSFAALLLPGLGGAALLEGKSTTHAAIGIYLLGWAIFTGIMMIASFRTTGATAAVFVLLFLTFLCLAIAKLSGNASFGTYGGYLGIVTAIAAWYDAAAGVLATVGGGRIKLPTFPLA